MPSWEVAAFWGCVTGALFVLIPACVEMITRAIVRGIIEERSAAIRRTYVSERKREDDGK